MTYRIGFMEGYNLMRKVKANWFSSIFMVFVWVLRGDEISDTK